MIEMHRISGVMIVAGHEVFHQTSCFSKREAVALVNGMNKRGDRMNYDGIVEVTGSLTKESSYGKVRSE